MCLRSNMSKYSKMIVKSFLNIQSQFEQCGAPVGVMLGALTVHGHTRSQRVSLRGVSRTLPCLCQKKNRTGKRSASLCPLGAVYGSMEPGCWLRPCTGKRKEQKKPTSLSHAHLLCGTLRDTSGLTAAPCVSPPPAAPHLTAGRQKVITHRQQLLLEPDWILPLSLSLPLPLSLPFSLYLSLPLSRMHTTHTPHFIMMATIGYKRGCHCLGSLLNGNSSQRSSDMIFPNMMVLMKWHTSDKKYTLSCLNLWIWVGWDLFVFL